MSQDEVESEISLDEGVPDQSTLETEKQNNDVEFQSLELLKKYPFDFMAWKLLLGELKFPSREQQDCPWKKAFDLCLEKMPPIPSLWLELIRKVKSHSSGSSNLALVFKNGLCRVRSLELCKKYISYVKVVRNVPSANKDQNQKLDNVLCEAYELVLDRVGHETDSGSLWLEYILYLRSYKPETAYEEQKNIENIRSAYQRAVSTPIFNIEKLWTEYDQFENSLNDLAANKILSSKSVTYINARAALCDLRNHYNAISKLKKMVPNTNVLKWNKSAAQLYDSWMALINWEKSNPIKYDDKSLCQTRVMVTYDKALMQLRNFPEIWYDATMYYLSINKYNAAINILKMGIEAIPYSLLLNLYHIQILEGSATEPTGVYEAFDKLIDVLESRVKDYLDSLANKNPIIKEEEISDNSEIDSKPPWDNVNGTSDAKSAPIENDKILNDRKNNLSIAWIHYIHTVRRMQGIKAARSIFNRARKSEYCTYHVWVVSARMEYNYNKDPITAGKVLQVGLKKFSTGQDSQLSGLLEHYLDFLISLNDDGNIRAFIMNTLSQSNKSFVYRKLWERSIKYETENGSLSNIQKLEKMRTEAFRDEDVFQKRLYLADRWTFLDIDTIAVNELGIKARTRMSNSTNVTIQSDSSIEMNKNSMSSHEQSTSQQPTLTSIQQAKFEQAGQSKKKINPLLKSVDPDKYPRPNLKSWMLISVDQPMQNPPEINTKSKLSSWPVNTPLLTNVMPPPPGVIPSNSISTNAISAPSNSVSASSNSISAPSNSISAPSNVMPLPPNVIPPQSKVLMIYPAIAQLLSQLPAASDYDGPMLFVDECINIISKTEIPPPLTMPQLVPWVISNNIQGDGNVDYSNNMLINKNDVPSGQNNLPPNATYMDNQLMLDNFTQQRDQAAAPGFNNMGMHSYMQPPPQFDDRWSFNNQKFKNWKQRGRSRGGNSGSGGGNKNRSGHYFGRAGDKSLGRNFKKKMRGANNHPIGTSR